MPLVRSHKELPVLTSILLPSGLLSGIRWLETDVSELPIGPIFKGQAVQEKGLSSRARVYVAGGIDGANYPESEALANRVSEVWRTWKREVHTVPTGCSEGKRPPPVVSVFNCCI